jgi:hypothetical protein
MLGVARDEEVSAGAKMCRHLHRVFEIGKTERDCALEVGAVERYNLEDLKYVRNGCIRRRTITHSFHDVVERRNGVCGNKSARSFSIHRIQCTNCISGPGVACEDDIENDVRVDQQTRDRASERTGHALAHPVLLEQMIAVGRPIGLSTSRHSIQTAYGG